jgi:hypothetical protein
MWYVEKNLPEGTLKIHDALSVPTLVPPLHPYGLAHSG